MADSIRVLHVDDDPQFADMAATFLEREDERFSIDTAPSAPEGLERLRDDTFDCVVSDYEMPGKDGIEFLETVRREHPTLPFILYTGRGSEAVASEAISAGVTDYLQKESGTEQYAILANRIKNSVAQTRAQREVERTREYYSTILEHASDYVLIVDDAGKIDYVSPAVERVMGYPPDELEGSDAFEFIHPDDFSIAADAFAEIVESPNEERTVEYRARTADDTWQWLEVRGRNLFDDSVIDGILVNVRDITERKEREEEAERASQRLQEFSAGLTDCLWVFDRDWETLHYVSGYETVWDRPEAAIRDDPQDFLDGVHPEDLDRVHAAMDRLSNGDVIDCEFRILRRDDEVGWVWAKGNPIFEGEEVVRVVGFTRDITERKRRERELERQNERFDELASTLSHDLQTPIATAQGHAELAVETGDPEHMADARAAIDRTDELRKDLLEVLRTGDIVSETTSLDLGQISRTVWETLRTPADASLQVRQSPTVTADPNALRRLLENLLGNAIEHGNDDATVRIGQTDGGFYVEDDGPGIPPDVRDDVFTPGYTTKDVGGGIGLASVEQIVLAHGWDVQITDGSNGGTRVAVTTAETSD